MEATAMNPEDHTNSPNIRRSTRSSPVPDPYSAFALTFHTIAGSGRAEDPISFHEATASDARTNRKEAIDEKLSGIEDKRGVEFDRAATWFKSDWKRVGVPAKRERGWYSVELKVRLVENGYSQRSGIDYGEVYAPVARYSTIRVFLATAIQNRSGLLKLDVRVAFLNVPLQKELYIHQPDDYVQN